MDRRLLSYSIIGFLAVIILFALAALSSAPGATAFLTLIGVEGGIGDFPPLGRALAVLKSPSGIALSAGIISIALLVALSAFTERKVEIHKSTGGNFNE